MRIICDAPGQTCNRLWTYVTTVSRCIALKKKMVILFFDWTIEDFPNLLHCPFIYFPLYHKWYLEHGNGWNNYKGLTWKATHNETMDKVFDFFGCKKGWYLREDTKYLKQTKKELQKIFEPRKEIMNKCHNMVDPLKGQNKFVVGVHIRRGDYATWNDGKFFYSLEQYHQFMLQVQDLYHDRKIVFFISSNENFDVNEFEGCECYRFGKEPSGAILDLYTLSLCDVIMGPFSSYSRWASFIGEVPICWLESKDMEITDSKFAVMLDYFNQANGYRLEDW